MNEQRLPGFSFSHSTSTVVATTSILILVWTTVELVSLYLLDFPTFSEPRYMVGFLTIIPSCIGMIYGARWLRRSDIPPDQHPRITKYWLIGGVGFLAFNVGLMSFFPTESIWIVLNWGRWALTFGFGIGLIVGIAQARSVISRLAAERESLRAEHVEKQRNLIDQMNGLLRHEVLNSTQVITGNASALMDSDEAIEPTDERITRIHRQGEEITRVVQEVRVLLSTIEDERTLETTNLTDVIETQVQKIRDQYPRIDVELRCPEGIHVHADELLGRAFGNVLRNSAEHNDTAALQITVDVERVDQSVIVTIEDNGGGIPERKLEALFDRPLVSDHGLGLYLVRELTNSYDGTVELSETGEEGTVFRFRLPSSETSP